MMFEGMRRSVGMSLAGWKLRKLPDQLVRFTASVSSARSMLVVLPLGNTDGEPLRPLIEILHTSFSGVNYTFVTPMHGVELIRTLPTGKFIELMNTDLTSWYLPRGSFLTNLPHGGIDVAVDLNLDFQLPSGYICRKSGALVTIGFASKYSDRFYNFIVQAAPETDRRGMYRRMATCLQMF
jgi:hypothetical protein